MAQHVERPPEPQRDKLGYQPLPRGPDPSVPNLDPSNPPRGGSGLPPLRPSDAQRSAEKK